MSKKNPYSFWGDFLNRKTASDRCISLIFVIILATLAFFLLDNAYKMGTVVVPADGGTLREGILGIPRTPNPFFATRQSEIDIVSLVHAGLITYSPQKKDFVLALASNVVISDDNLVYDFFLKDDLVFHDDEPLTASDVVFTVEYIKQLGDITPLYSKWKDVTVEEIKSNQVRFTLPVPRVFIPQATLPILPSHIWKKIPVRNARDYDGVNAFVGTGPYYIDSVKTTINGLITEMNLKPFDQYYKKSPFISIDLFFFQTHEKIIEAINNKTIDAYAGISPVALPDVLENKMSSLYLGFTSRVFAGFFNTRDTRVFSDPFIRASLVAATDQKQLTEKIFGSYAVPVYTPLSHDTYERTERLETEQIVNSLKLHLGLTDNGEETTEETEEEEEPAEKEPEALSISTIKVVIPNIEETRRFIKQAADQWKQIGLETDLRLFNPSEYSLEKSYETDFDIFFFGYNALFPHDLSTLWNSANPSSFSAVGGYGSSEINELLTSLQSTVDDTDKDLLYTALKTEFEKDNPAVFFYSPLFLYILPDKIQNVGESNDTDTLGTVIEPGDRYTNVSNWYIKTKRVFRKKR